MNNTVVRFDGLGHFYHPSRWVFQGYRGEVIGGSPFVRVTSISDA